MGHGQVPLSVGKKHCCSPNLTSDHGKELPGAVGVTGPTGESQTEKEGQVGHGMNK